MACRRGRPIVGARPRCTRVTDAARPIRKGSCHCVIQPRRHFSGVSLSTTPRIRRFSIRLVNVPLPALPRAPSRDRHDPGRRLQPPACEVSQEDALWSNLVAVNKGTRWPGLRCGRSSGPGEFTATSRSEASVSLRIAAPACEADNPVGAAVRLVGRPRFGRARLGGGLALWAPFHLGRR
jgi:hypothetical protein